MTDEGFEDLIRRVRLADEAAAAELVERFGPELRRVVRVRFAEPLLQSVVDSGDICQSVLLDFFVRARLGQYEFASPRDLARLLSTMARHKLLNHARRARAARVVRAGTGGDPLAGLPAGGESPSDAATAADLIERAASLLTQDEHRLAALRRAGRDWAEVAAATGDTPEAARKRLARAAERVLTQLGLRPEAP